MQNADQIKLQQRNHNLRIWASLRLSLVYASTNNRVSALLQGQLWCPESVSYWHIEGIIYYNLVTLVIIRVLKNSERERWRFSFDVVLL